jgi:hypothetical protein
MPLQLRQLCLVTQDLEQCTRQLNQLLGLLPGHIDHDVEQFGARNTIFPLGKNFIEVINPISPKAASQRYIDSRGGDSGYMVITQADSRETQQAIRAEAEKLGVRVAFEITARGADFLQWHPADTGGTFLETTFDHLGELEGSWDPSGGHACDSIESKYPLELVSVGISTRDPEATALRWGQLTLGPASTNADGNPQVNLNNASIYFVKPDEQHPNEGLNRIHLRSPDCEAILDNARTANALSKDASIDLCGVSFYIRPLT